MDPKTLEILLSIVPGVVLARVGTAALKAVGYQVLDVPGTWALKDACLRKPEAAVLRVANPVGSSARRSRWRRMPPWQRLCLLGVFLRGLLKPMRGG